MSLPIVLRTEAEEEFNEAFDWYEKRKIGLGVAFTAKIQAIVNEIARNPNPHAVVFSDIRKAVVRQFPYCVFYRPHLDRIEVVAVFHSKRNPSIWQNRL